MVSQVRDGEELGQVVEELGLAEVAGPGPVLVKVPWFSPHPANYVGARELDLLLSCLPPGRRVVVEGYSGARNYGGREITPDNDRENWKWIREQDRLFLDREGIGEVLSRHGAEYLNVTEEIWRGRVAPAAAVREAVEGAYPAATTPEAATPAVAQEELYGVVPQALFDLRGSLLISFAKLKSGSWSLKNLFGLIPDPNRSRWHGEQGELLGRSVIDISAIYRALFRVVGMVEGINEVPVYLAGTLAGGDTTGAEGVPGAPGRRRRYHTDWGDYEVVPGPGVVLAGWQLVTLDVCAARVLGSEIGERSFARIGEAVFKESARVPPELEPALGALARRLAADAS